MARRAERAAATREAILNAAVAIVGAHGYAKASVARIAEEAGVAHGLIYVYFDNQQDLFEQVLPHVGEAMLRHIASKIAGAKTFAERERLGLKVNFEYLRRHPALHRVLNEAAFFAPQAHQSFLQRMAGGYMRSLKLGRESGEIEGYGSDELEVLAYMIIGAREYLLERYAAHDGVIDPLPEAVERTYRKVVARSLGIAISAMDPGGSASGEAPGRALRDRS